jgi:hypothetical protein
MNPSARKVPQQSEEARVEQVLVQTEESEVKEIQIAYVPAQHGRELGQVQIRPFCRRPERSILKRVPTFSAKTSENVETDDRLLLRE